MLLDELLKGMPVQGSGDGFPSVEIDRIEYDSRKISAGCLFVCMPGARADGHDYAPLAYELGCRHFLAERKLDLPEDALQFFTKDTRALLPHLSARFYGDPAKKLHLIGITGTKGKTTTSLLVSAILNSAGLPTAYIGSNGVLINDQEIETANTPPESRDLHMFFRMMVDAGIRCVVMEDREEFAKPELFPTAEEIILCDMYRIGDYMTITEEDYVCVMTRGHAHDTVVQAQILRCHPCYCGVIGSIHKAAGVRKVLKEVHGLTDAELDLITTPIGLPIKGETPAEIAISICAQMILHRAERSRR